MKNVIRFMTLGLFGLMACSSKNDVSPKTSFVNSLTASAWVPVSVYNESDGDLTSQYTDFSIVFTEGAANGYMGDYYVANGSHAFSSAFGKWKISDDLKTMTMDNGRAISIQIANGQLKLDFTVPPKNGRIDGLSGHFTFLLKTF